MKSGKPFFNFAHNFINFPFFFCFRNFDFLVFIYLFNLDWPVDASVVKIFVFDFKSRDQLVFCNFLVFYLLFLLLID